MAGNKEAQKILKDEATTDLSAESEMKKRKIIKKKEIIEKNPDVEDPRLVSPLQEPDRPAPRERINKESEDSGSSSA